MHWHVIAHGDRFTACIVDCARIIAPLLDIGAERSLAKHGAHFVCNGDEEVSENLQIARCATHQSSGSFGCVMGGCALGFDGAGFFGAVFGPTVSLGDPSFSSST